MKQQVVSWKNLRRPNPTKSIQLDSTLLQSTRPCLPIAETISIDLNRHNANAHRLSIHVIFSTNGDRSQFKIVCVKVKRFAHFSLPKRHCRTVCLRYALELLLLLLLFKLFGYLPFQIPYHPMDTCSLRFYWSKRIARTFLFCDAFVFIHKFLFRLHNFFLRIFCESFLCLKIKFSQNRHKDYSRRFDLK